MERTFEDKIKKLKSLPIYTMSLGSKELFHSNFWAWLMDRPETKEFIHCFFENIKENLEISREDKDRDIVLKDADGKEYVIENKIKSFPDEDQLKRYSNRGNFVKGVITGVQEPPFKLPAGWEFISYKKIAKYLFDKILPVINDKELYIVLKQYCFMVNEINEVIEDCLNQTKNFYDPWPTNKHKLLNDRDIRLLDVYQKLNADILYKKVFMKIRDNFESDDFCITIGRDYHHCKPTLDMNLLYKTYKDDDRCKQKQLSISIEGYDFRLVYRNDGCKEDDVVKDGLRLGWFEKYDRHDNKTIRGYATNMRDNHCQFSHKYIYQYFNLWNDQVTPVQDLLTLEQIEKLLIKEINKAKKIVESHKSEFIPPFK